MDRSNDRRWKMAASLEDLLSQVATIKEAQKVIIQHTLHYDPLNPAMSLDSIYDEARRSARQVERLHQLLSAAWVAIVAQINGIPVELPMMPDEVEELRQKLERRRDD